MWYCRFHLRMSGPSNETKTCSYCVGRKAFPLLWWEQTRSTKWMETRCWAVKQTGESLKVRHQFSRIHTWYYHKMNTFPTVYRLWSHFRQSRWVGALKEQRQLQLLQCNRELLVKKKFSWTSLYKRVIFLTLEYMSSCIGLFLPVFQQLHPPFLLEIRHPISPMPNRWEISPASMMFIC